jgi:hypothetical protein
MTKPIYPVDLDNFPVMKKSNARLHKAFFCLMVFGVILPFLLPESSWLIDSSVMRWLSSLVPSAGKLARVAQAPNVVHAYVLIALSLSVIFGIFLFLSAPSLHGLILASIAIGAPKSLLTLWLKAIGGIVFWAALLYLLYVLPGKAPNTDSGGSRGQLILSLMVMTKPGLAVFGGFVSGGLMHVWFFWFFAIYSFFKIPFLAFQSKP